MRPLYWCLFAMLLPGPAHGVSVRFDADSQGCDAITSQIQKTFNDAESWNKKGIDALERKDFEAALADFEEALRIFPGYDDATNNRGVVYFRRGDIGSAQEIWKKLAAREPNYALASYNLSLVNVHENNYEAAVTLLERSLRADKHLIEARVRLGAVLLEMGQKRKALDELAQAYSAAPGHPDSWSWYAYALLQIGDTAKAIGILQKNGSQPEALKMIGRIEKSRGNGDRAAKSFAQAASQSSDPGVLIELADAQLSSKNCREAVQTMKTYFSRPPPYASDAWLTAGAASKECGDLAGAQRWFEQGVKNFPKDGILRYNLGLVCFLQKKNEAAESAWSGLADSLQDPSFLYVRALNAGHRSDLVAAEALIRKALQLDDRAEFHDFLGVVLFRKNEAKPAEREFREALRIDPALRSAQLNLALCTRGAGDLAAAAAALEKRRASCVGDSCTDLALRLSTLYYYQKQTQKAVRTLLSVPESEREEQTYRCLAVYYRDLRDWDNAIAALETAVKKFVTDPQTEYELAEAYLYAGHFAKAIERFSRLVDRWQKNPWRLYYQIGYAWFEQNEMEKAKEAFEKSLNSKKDNVAARGLLAFICNREGNAGRARELWKKNLSDDPSNAALWVNMGLSYERDGKYDEAIEHYTKAAALSRDDPQIQINIGNVYAATGRYTDALQAYKQALGSPKKEVALYDIFLVHAKRRDRGQAEETARQLERDFPSSVNLRRARSELQLWAGDTAAALTVLEGIGDKEAGDWATLGRVYAAQGKRQKAQACLAAVPDEAQWAKERAAIKTELAFAAGDYQEVIALVRESRDTSLASQYNCALASYNLKQYADALATAELLVKRASGSDRADLCRLAGNSAFCLKQWKNALQWYLQLSNVEASSAVVQYNLAVAAYNLNDVENAYKYYERARELDPKIVNADIEKRYAANHTLTKSITTISPIDSLYNAAVGLQNAGRDTAAEKLYESLLAQDSLYSMAWNNLGAIYGKWGRIDSAAAAYQKAVGRKHDIPETYANLVNLYIEIEEFAAARQWLLKGEMHNPESDMLKGMKQKIADAEKKAKKRR